MKLYRRAFADGDALEVPNDAWVVFAKLPSGEWLLMVRLPWLWWRSYSMSGAKVLTCDETKDGTNPFDGVTHRGLFQPSIYYKCTAQCKGFSKIWWPVKAAFYKMA